MIWVDADACPVKAEIERVATRHAHPVSMVSNGGLRPSTNALVEMVYVPSGLDVADDYIAERAGAGDVVITSDIPLAARCVAAGAHVLRPDGDVLNSGNIGNILATRDLMTNLRSADPFMQGGAKSFSKANRSDFLTALDRVLTALRRRD